MCPKIYSTLSIQTCNKCSLFIFKQFFNKLEAHSYLLSRTSNDHHQDINLSSWPLSTPTNQVLRNNKSILKNKSKKVLDFVTHLGVIGNLWIWNKEDNKH